MVAIYDPLIGQILVMPESGADRVLALPRRTLHHYGQTFESSDQILALVAGGSHGLYYTTAVGRELVAVDSP